MLYKGFRGSKCGFRVLGFPKIRSTWGGPNKKDLVFWRSIIGSPYLGN